MPLERSQRQRLKTRSVSKVTPTARDQFYLEHRKLPPKRVAVETPHSFGSREEWGESQGAGPSRPVATWPKIGGAYFLFGALLAGAAWRSRWLVSFADRPPRRDASLWRRQIWGSFSSCCILASQADFTCEFPCTVFFLLLVRKLMTLYVI